MRLNNLNRDMFKPFRSQSGLLGWVKGCVLEDLHRFWRGFLQRDASMRALWSDRPNCSHNLSQKVSSCVLGFFARGFSRKWLHWRGNFWKTFLWDLQERIRSEHRKTQNKALRRGSWTTPSQRPLFSAAEKVKRIRCVSDLGANPRTSGMSRPESSGCPHKAGQLKYVCQGRKTHESHRRDRIWRDFLHWSFRYFLQIGGSSY